MKKLLLLAASALCAVGVQAMTAAKDGIGYEYISPGHVRIVSCDPKSTSITIKGFLDGCYVDSIAADSFAKCTKLKSVKFSLVENYQITLDDDAFRGCTALTSVNFGLGDTVRFGKCFSGCTMLTSIVIPRYSTFADPVGFLEQSYLKSVTYLNDIGSYDGGFGQEGFDALADAGADGKLHLTTLAYPGGNSMVDYYLDKSKESKVSRRNWWNGVKLKPTTSGRIWARRSSTATGSLTFTVDGKTVANGSLVKKGKTVTVTCKVTKGKGVFSGLEIEQNSATEMWTSEKVSFKMSSGDAVVSCRFVTPAQELAKLRELSDNGEMLEPTETEGLTETTEGYRGTVGDYMGLIIPGSGSLLTKTTFALTGAPSGLKVRNLGPGRGYALEGVPASALSAEAAARAPVYLTAKGAGGSTVSFRVPLYFVRNSAYSVAHTCYKSKTTSFGLGDQYKVDWSSFTTVSPAVKGFSWTASSQAVKYKADAVGIKKVKLTRKVKGFPDGSSKRGSYSEFREIAFTALGTTPADVDFKNIPSEELGTVGVSYSRDVSAWFKGDKSPSMSNLPPGLKFNASKKKITGKPSKAGSWGVKIQKVVKNKKQTAYMLFRVSAGAGATIALNKTGAEIRSTGNMVAVLAGYKDTTSFSVSSSKAKVSVSGLPKGVSFKKQSNGTYKLSSSRPTKVGDYVVTVKVTLNGVTTTERYLYRIVPTPLAGTYRGYVVTTLGLGTTLIKVEQNGKATLTMQEGSIKSSKITAYPSSVADWQLDSQNVDGCVYKFKLPSVKKKVGARTATVVLKSTQEGDLRYADSPQCVIQKDSSNRGASQAFTANAVFGSYGAFWDVFPAVAEKASMYYRLAIVGAGYYNTGDGFYAYVDASGGKSATVKGRLPAGKSFTLTLPYSYDCAYKAGVFAPGAVTDNDGQTYLIRPTLVVEEFNSSSNIGTPLVFHKEFGYAVSVEGEYSYSRDEAAVDFRGIAGDTGSLIVNIGGKEMPLGMKFTSKTSATIDGGKVTSCKYSSSTGLLTVVFTKGGYTYTAYLLQTEKPGLTKNVLNGVIKRVKGKKTVWGSACYKCS